MKTTLYRILMLAAMLLSLAAPATIAQAKADVSAQVKGTSPQGFLNPDGSLKLDGSFNGSLNLSGYNVRLDSQRGPIFAPAAQDGGPDPQTAANQWGKMGTGGEVFNNAITAIAVSGSNVYVGGNFHDAAGIPTADAIAKWDGFSWSGLGSNGSGDGALWGDVYTIAVSGSNVYAGGNFSDVNNNGTSLTAADYVAKWDGANWSALGSDGAGNGSLGSYVNALAVIGSNLYVGGDFLDVNNNGAVLATADYIAMWNGSNWSAMQSNGAGNGALNSYVTALAADVSGNLYVGGAFTDVHDGILPLSSADYIAKWDGSMWYSLGTGSSPTYGSLNYPVSAIAVSGTNVYVGGGFTNVNNAGTILGAADYIAKFDGSNWSALGSNGAGNGAISSTVESITVSGATVYAGGRFTDVNNNGTVLAAADNIARWNGASWSAVGSNGAGNGSIRTTNAFVLAMAFNGSNLIVGGIFFDLNNAGTVLTQADNLAQWTGSAWTSVGSVVGGSLTNRVFAVAISGTNVYVGGDFTNVQNSGVNIPAADYVAKWDTLTSKWSALGSNGNGDGSITNTVYALAVSGSNLYAGGYFSNTKNSDGNYVVGGDCIVRWDGVKWYGLGNDGSGNGPIWGSVYAIAVSGANVYAGGNFSNVKDNGTVLNNADYIAKFNGTHWSAMGSNGAGDGSLGNVVEAIAVIGSNVYAGGYFTDVNNNGAVLPTADYIAKWDGANWSALGSNGTGNGSINSVVYALAASGTTLYVGGSFNNVNNSGTILNAADYIAKWDGANWSALGSNGAGEGALQNSVDAIAVNGSNVYAGGWLTNTQNNNSTINPADYIVKFDGVNWSALGSNGAGDGALNNGVAAIAVSGANLYAGGVFTDVNNNGTLMQDADYIAAFGVAPQSKAVVSTGAQDGWILESSETSNVGGTINSTATTINLGDDKLNKQYLGILSFATGAALPDNAVITAVTLKIKQQSIVGGGNPVSTFQGFMVDIKNGLFGTSALQAADFQTAANKTYGPFATAAVGGWYSISLTAGKGYVNKLATNSGLTQIRLRFKLDDNNNVIANYLSLFSGNAPAGSQPQLVITYYVP